MEALTRLVADSLARHGFDRPVDPRRLQWSRWFRCDSPHSLLVVPSKPGIFALAEEIMDLGPAEAKPEDGLLRRREDGLLRREVASEAPSSSPEGATFISPGRKSGVGSQVGTESRRDGTNSDATASKRMLAVLQFSEDDDMAFTLDRMFTQINPMRARLASGRCFLRFVVIEDQSQRRNICNALNQWMHSSAEKASGIGVDFQSSLELTDVGTARVGRTLLSDSADSTTTPAQTVKAQPSDAAPPAPNLDSGANKNLHCPLPLPSGF
ncbi:MAG: hypothetical protein WAO04_01665 [Candidatus Sulfotelmatobacter sp.]